LSVHWQRIETGLRPAHGVAVRPLAHRWQSAAMTATGNFSLRARLTIGVVLLIVPLVVLIWLGAHRQFQRSTRELEEEVQRLTVFVAGDVNQLLAATREMLTAVVEIHLAGDPQRTRALLADLDLRCPYYTRFGVASLSGTTCRTESILESGPAPANEELLRRAAASRRLAIGTPIIRPFGGTNLLPVAYCVAAERGTNRALVAYTALDLQRLNTLLTEARVGGQRSLFPREMILNVMDRSGTILTRYPDMARWTGRRLRDTAVVQEIIRKGEGTADLTGVDGQSRYYAFLPVPESSGDLFVCTGVSRHTALAAARSDQQRTLAAVFTVGLILILGAWFGTGIFVLRPLAALLQATQRLGRGDLAARARVARGPHEIIRLAGTFDRMAETLQRDARERERLQAEIVAYDRQLRSMSVEATLAEERERRQIAAGLHDKAGPLLATCYMKLGRLLKAAPPEPMARVLAESRALLDEALGNLRVLIFDLSSPTLYTLGLTAAVEELCQETARHHALAIEFRDQGAPAELPGDQRIVLYRAARELLFNVLKHAEATRVTVCCGGDAEGVFVAVEDNGVGFDSAAIGRGFNRAGGFGLFNLRERVEHLGGRLVVTSSRGTGTRAVVTIPAAPQDEAQEERHEDQGAAG
jgi:signal transduction histidine kinase